MFNDYIWNIYLNGPGKETVKNYKKNLTTSFSKEYCEQVSKLHREYCPSKLVNNSLKEELMDLYNDIYDGLYFFEEGDYTIDSATKYIFDTFMDECSKNPKQAFDYFSGSIAYFTTLFALELSEILIPYYFTYNFNVFERITQEFGIEIEKIPAKKDYKARFLYYGSICESLYNFRQEHDMNQYELCAFLYDFAPKYIGGVDSYIVNDIPKSQSAYFIGASKDDFLFSTSNDTVTPWQCNPDTLVGDSIVMYVKYPISSIDSIWRSVSVGFNDPFFYYYRCTYIAKPIKVNRISQKQMREDEILSKLSIVKKICRV